MGRNIYIIAEHDEGHPSAVTYELTTCARRMAAAGNNEIHVVILGKTVAGMAERLAGETGLSTICLEGESLDTYTAEGYQKALTGLLSGVSSAWVIIPHTSRGADYGPGLACLLDASCITTVHGIDRRDCGPVFRRACAWGKLEAEVSARRPVAVITVMPGAFGYEKEPRPCPGIVSFLKADIDLTKTLSCRLIRTEPGSRELRDAETIVGAGLGVENGENMVLIRDLAGMFRRSAVGGSRAVCDRGWLDYQAQIGLTGKTVAPRLYIACGISGSMQHVAGIKGSQTIVAINKDRQAPIFRQADVGVVADLKTFIPSFIAALKQIALK